MKILLLLTVCEQNLIRISNLIKIFKAQRTEMEKAGFEPLFVVGTPCGTIDFEGYKHIRVNVEEKYTNHYLKLFESFKQIMDMPFDYICKADDDTYLDFSRFDPAMIEGYDYAGRLIDNDPAAAITVVMNIFMLQKELNFFPPFFNEQFKFPTGDCYFLNKKAISYILSQEKVLELCNNRYVLEDKLNGYILSKSGLKSNNINVYDDFAKNNLMQITTNYFSIHPVSNIIYMKLLGKSVQEQQQIINENKIINLSSRFAYINTLEEKIKQAVMDFSNSKKSIGLG
jgi:hypothetical protein